MDVEQARIQMIDQQVRAWNVLDPDVLRVMADVPREAFVPDAYARLAFADTAIPLACGQEMMVPTVEGRMLQALAIRPGDQVFEVGTGTGFTAACMTALGGAVATMDIHPELAERAAATLEAQRFTTVKVETGDALELDADKRYDAIAVTGGLPQRHAAFEKALRIGGRLFVVIGSGPVMEALLIQRVSDTDWLSESLFETRLPLLENARVPEPFVFQIPVEDISVRELADRLRADTAPVVLDVREPWEVRAASLDSAVCVPMNEIPARLDEVRGLIGDGAPLAVLCHSGVRSRHVGRFLEQNGFAGVLNVAGGIDAWSRDVDPAVPRY